MNKFLVLLMSILFSCLFFVSVLSAEEFPARKKYPMAPPISTQDLYKDYEAGKVVIVDVRSNIEYKVIHPVNAAHIPVGKMGFVSEVKKLIAENPGKKIAFYCNGVTCLKSYEATKKSIEAGLKNVYVYDAGIPGWANAYPGKTLLLGKPIVDPEKQLIPKSEFKKKALPFEEFRAKTQAGNALTIDVRDNIQRTASLPGIGQPLTIPLDRFIPGFVERRVNQDKTLFIFDQVGKQVRWLEYYLVEYGYKNYYFLKGGATAVLKEQKYK